MNQTKGKLKLTEKLKIKTDTDQLKPAAHIR
jgi:hypothetical protein